MLAGLNTYRVSRAARKPLIEFMVSALESAGCQILYCSGELRAPFVITFETATGERLGVVAYAFLATRTPTRNRPADERRGLDLRQRRIDFDRHLVIANLQRN